MKTKLISITQPMGEHANLTPEQLITYCARVSNPGNQDNHDTAPKLLRFLIRHGHWSPFEMVSVCYEIETSLAIATQIVRHRSFSFQQFCITGDTEVYFEKPQKLKKGIKTSYKLTIEHLYRNWKKNPKTYEKMYLRVLDTDTNEFTTAHLKEVFKSGEKDVFLVTLACGKKIECSKDHKFMTENGSWLPLKDIVGLSQASTGKAVIERRAKIAVNGIPAHQNKNWLEQAKLRSIKSKKGVQGIADEAGVSYHTIRKWLRIHELTFSKKEVAEYREIWNKGKTGYKNKPHSEETRAKMRAAAKTGPDNPLWRGGVKRDERQKICDYISKYRNKIYEKYDYKCSDCKVIGSTLHLHHIKPVYSHPELAYDINNIEPLCKDCHHKHHNINGDQKVWKKRSKGNLMVLRYSEIQTVEYKGKKMTYDLEVDHSSHNYVANGIVTHNSQRYSEAEGMEPIELRKQGKTNRQSSSDVINSWRLKHEVETTVQLAMETYNKLIKSGVAREVARLILPTGTKTRLYMNGTLRSWLHYLELRCKENTQKEHRLIAESIKADMAQYFPVIFEAFEGRE